MNHYLHHVSGLFANRMEAEITLNKIIDTGIPHERTNIFDSSVALPATTHQARSNAVLKDMVVDGAIGTTVGTGIGALAEMALVLENVTLFIASPLLAPLALVGLGASLGGMVGATVGTQGNAPKKAGWFSDLIKNAISHGQVVLVIKTINQEESKNIQKIIQSAVGNSSDVNAA